MQAFVYEPKQINISSEENVWQNNQKKENF